MTDADFVKAWRSRMGLSQEEAAKRLGYKRGSSISQFENGHDTLPIKTRMLMDLLELHETFPTGAKS
jgi:transcriptional regulator with XRE-family HTH domain